VILLLNGAAGRRPPVLAACFPPSPISGKGLTKSALLRKASDIENISILDFSAGWIKLQPLKHLADGNLLHRFFEHRMKKLLRFPPYYRRPKMFLAVGV
jgi:hypothetical protein